MEEELIKEHSCELSEPPCGPGSGRYGIKIILADDISPVFPYLNAILEDTVYDHLNKVLIGRDGLHMYAFRQHEIRVSDVDESMQTQMIAQASIAFVNHVWQIRDSIKPCLAERKIPTAFDIYRHLPKTNCRQCGYATCLVFATELRQRKCQATQCPLLGQSEYAIHSEAIRKLFAAE